MNNTNIVMRLTFLYSILRFITSRKIHPLTHHLTVRDNSQLQISKEMD